MPAKEPAEEVPREEKRRKISPEKTPTRRRRKRRSKRSPRRSPRRIELPGPTHPGRARLTSVAPVLAGIVTGVVPDTVSVDVMADLVTRKKIAQIAVQFAIQARIHPLSRRTHPSRQAGRWCMHLEVPREERPKEKARMRKPRNGLLRIAEAKQLRMGQPWSSIVGPASSAWLGNVGTSYPQRSRLRKNGNAAWNMLNDCV